LLKQNFHTNLVLVLLKSFHTNLVLVFLASKRLMFCWHEAGISTLQENGSFPHTKTPWWFMTCVR
jgi:hypothetical protein